MSKAARIGIAGCGAITELYYAPALREVQAAGRGQVTALFDPDGARLNLLMQMLPGAQGFTSFAEFAAAGLDLGIVASPARFHAEQALALLKAGSFVLCEKPMAATVGEAEEMLKVGGDRLAVGLFRRFFPAARLIRDYLTRETLGKPVLFDFAEGGAFNWPAQSASFFQKKTAQGGVFLDLGVHMLDLALWWFGEPAGVEYEDDAMGGLEINSLARFTFANGVRGAARLSRDWQTVNRYVIHCERGWLAWNVGAANEVEIGGGAEKGISVRGQINQDGRAAASYHESFVLQLLNCLDALGGRTELVVPASEGIRSLRLIERCYKSRKFLRMPWFSEEEMRRGQELASA